MTHLSFTGSLSRPWIPLVFGKRKKSLQPGESCSEIVAEWDDVPMPNVESYLTVCGFENLPDGAWPITFPQVLLTPLHMQIIARPEFPFPALGLVHVRQKCLQHHPITSSDTIRAKSWIDGLEFRRKGAEITIHSEIYGKETLLWSAETTVFSRHPKGHGQSDERARADQPTADAVSETWSLRSDLGRRYTKVSGDFNPIHLYAWSAKIFGFERAIIHGMWSIAHALSKTSPCPRSLTVNFVRPVMLPSEPTFVHDSIEGVGRFWISNSETNKVCLWGCFDE